MGDDVCAIKSCPITGRTPISGAFETRDGLLCTNEIASVLSRGDIGFYERVQPRTMALKCPE